MRQSFIAVVAVTLLAAASAFLIPVPTNNGVLAAHIQWAVAIAQSATFIFAALFTLQATFRVAALAGLIGNSLKIFSIGLFFFGLGFAQLPLVAIFGLWSSPYFTKGIYWALYLIAFLLCSIAFIISASHYTRKALLYSGLIAVAFIIVRLALLPVPFSSVLYKTPAQFEAGLTLATVMSIAAGILIMLSALLRNTFGKSKIGSIFNLFTGAFVFIFIGAIMGYPIIIATGVNAWWYTYGLYYCLFVAAGLLFVRFSLKLKYFRL